MTESITESKGSSTDDDNAERRGVGKCLPSLAVLIAGDKSIVSGVNCAAGGVDIGSAVTIDTAISVNVAMADVDDGLGLSSGPSVSGFQMTSRIGNNFVQLLTIKAMLMKFTLAGAGGGTGRSRRDAAALVLLQNSSDAGITAGLDGGI